MERIISDGCLQAIRATAYEAGKRCREVYTVRAADGPEVVRCRDCRCFDAYESCDAGWCSGWECLTEADGFCHLGEGES